MPIVPSTIPNLLGGVSRVAQSLRAPNEFEAMDNVELDPVRGAQKRPGAQFIEGGGTQGSLDVDSPTTNSRIFWIDRAENEQFVGFIDPDATDADKVIQVFDLSGAEQTVEGDGDGDGTPAALSAAENDDLRAYLALGSGDLRRRIRPVVVEDATFVLNRTAVATLTGGRITYQNSDSPANVRNQNNAQNVAAWSDADQPPTNTRDLEASPIPIGEPADANVNVNDDAFWFMRDDDVGEPTGFRAAVSADHPPWYQRIRTEGRESVIRKEVFPLRLDFDGSQFTLGFVDWTARLAGDSTSNPGPSWIGNAVSDIVFHQDRLFFLSGDAVFGSRSGDVFNLWIDSPILRNDADPIDRRIFGNNTAIIDYGVSFQDSLILLTRASKQVELRANGPLAPSTSFLSPTTSIDSVEYVQPATMGSQMYFLGERDFAHTVYEYLYDPNAFSNVAREITERVQGYIPAEASMIVPNEATEQLFILTDAEPNTIYVYRTKFQSQQRTMAAWYRWTFDSGDEILSIQPFDNFLYMVVRRDDLVFLQRIPLGVPEQDTDDVSGPLQGLGYNIPIDRKFAVTGVYDAMEDTTTWTLPFADDTIDELVLGPAWDQDSGMDHQRLAGLRLTPTVAIVGDTTTLTVDGQYATNLLGDAAKAFAGRGFTKRITLSEQFVRDQQGSPVQGNYQLMTVVIQHKDTGFYALEITPSRRTTLRQEFVVPFVGSTLLDSEVLDPFGEFQTRVFTASHNCTLEIVNDSPLPSSIVDVQFQGEFVPFARSPVK